MFFKEYFHDISNGLNSVLVSEFKTIAELFISTSKKGGKIIFVGNGGSASIAGHLTVDCINAAGIKAINFNDPGVITCFANDYGYENWVGRALDCYADSGDLAVLISSSGQSENMLVGAKKAHDLGVNVVTLTGFSDKNQLRKLGDINLWIDSNKYNVIEMTHHVWLLAIVDYIIENNKEK
jgi:D-sedoheptulose 7-phosphate isomerase